MASRNIISKVWPLHTPLFSIKRMNQRRFFTKYTENQSPTWTDTISAGREGDTTFLGDLLKHMLAFPTCTGRGWGWGSLEAAFTGLLVSMTTPFLGGNFTALAHFQLGHIIRASGRTGEHAEQSQEAP